MLLCAAAVFVSAEPPVSSYLPPNQQPSSQYGAPSGFGNSGPSNNYQQQQKPSSQYGAPANSYIPPSNNFAPPQSQYGAPSNTAAVYKPQPQYGAPSAGAGGYGNGQNDYESKEPARYNFEYNVLDYQSGNDFGHMETRDGDRTTGRYYVLLPDGRKQIVTYEADQNGYRPTITYEQTNQQGNNNQQGGGYNANAQSGKFNGY